MKVKQIADLLNQTFKEVLGEEALQTEDLSNVIDMGKSLLNAEAVDNYVQKLTDRIGKLVCEDRAYKGSVPSVLMDNWEYGSITEIIDMELPEVTENESWKLKDGQDYSPNVFTAPKGISVKFYNSKTTFEVKISFTDLQVKESFDSARNMDKFMSMIYVKIYNTMNLATENLIKRTINNFTAQTLFAEYPNADYTTKSGVRARNLLKEYNDLYGASLTVGNALYTPEFIRYAVGEMSNIASYLQEYSSLYNIGGTQKFTPLDKLHVVLLSAFSNYAKVYLQSDTIHNEYTQLLKHETVASWQGTGVTASLEDRSKIDITIKTTDSTKKVQCGYILGVMFDRDALGVTQFNKRVTIDRNARAEFRNEWYKQDASYFNNLNQNYVMFFMA